MAEKVTVEALRRVTVLDPLRGHTAVDLKPRRLEWVGIGWIDVGEPRGDEDFIVDRQVRRRGAAATKRSADGNQR